MDPIRLFPIIALISLPTVMLGGYVLHRFITRGEGLTTRGSASPESAPSEPR